MEFATHISPYSGPWRSHEGLCPYCDRESEICGASCSAMSIDRHMRTKYCQSEDFDDCPVFLAKRLSGR